MWNHYAKGYTRAVLELRAREDLDSPLTLARPIVYQDTPPRIADPRVWVSPLLAGNQGRGLSDLFRELQYVKTVPWAYEKEWRVVSFKRRHDVGLYSDWVFHPLELTSVYLGSQSYDDHSAQITNLAATHFPHAAIFRARLPPGAISFSFDLTG